MADDRRAARQLEIFGELLRWILPAARTDAGFAAGLQQRLARDRRFGSRDRRLYRELAYAAVRLLPRLEAAAAAERPRLALRFAPDTPVLAPLRTALSEPPQTPPAGDDLWPAWIATECPSLADDAGRRLQLQRPPVWLRLRPARREEVLEFLQREGFQPAGSPVAPAAVALAGEIDVTRSALFAAGAFEIQDLGSQLVGHFAGPRAGESWLDACAGAGGKTLQLADAVGPAGRVVASDVRPAALEELQARVRRAQLANVSVVPPDRIAGLFDGVLVDAPCSGSGTWRRHPHLKWQTTPASLATHATRQLAILGSKAPFVRPGGRLVYATCSLARRENEGVVAAFLDAFPGFHVEPPADALGCAVGPGGITIPPTAHNTDGFFVSVLRRG